MTPDGRISEAELHAYLDGELTPEDRAEVETLLAASPAESGLMHDFRDLNEALGQRYASRLADPVPASMLALLTRIPRRRPLRATRLAAFAAALLIAFTAGLGGYLARGFVTSGSQLEPSFVVRCT